MLLNVRIAMTIWIWLIIPLRSQRGRDLQRCETPLPVYQGFAAGLTWTGSDQFQCNHYVITKFDLGVNLRLKSHRRICNQWCALRFFEDVRFNRVTAALGQ